MFRKRVGFFTGFSDLEVVVIRIGFFGRSVELYCVGRKFIMVEV